MAVSVLTAPTDNIMSENINNRPSSLTIIETTNLEMSTMITIHIFCIPPPVTLN